MPIIISRFTNPYTNLSIGSYIAKKMISPLVPKLLFLCSSHHGVFIGNNQNLWKECDTEKMKRDGVPLVRRDTGGGACYVDSGNRLFSFFEFNSKPNFKQHFPTLIDALNTLDLQGQTAQMQGSNDIVIGSKKVSGSAFTFDGSVFRHHGTILINVDKNRLSTYLTPSKMKLVSKGITSVSARISNLTDINPGITQEGFDQALIQAFHRATNSQSHSVTFLDESNFFTVIKNAEYYQAIYDRYTSDEFIYNKNPEFTHKMEHRFSFGIVDISLTCTNNIIVSAEIFSDSLDLQLVEALKHVLFNKSYRGESVDLIEQELNEKLNGSKEKIEEFCNFLRTQFPAALQVITAEDKPSQDNNLSLRKSS
jgi:lipoate---protein ligase